MWRGVYVYMSIVGHLQRWDGSVSNPARWFEFNPQDLSKGERKKNNNNNNHDAYKVYYGFHKHSLACVGSNYVI